MKIFYHLVYLLIFSSFSHSFDYNHENYILSNIKSFPVSQETLNTANNANYYLNFSKFFETSLIQDFKRAHSEFQKDPTHKEVIINTKDGQKIECSFFDRKKEQVIVIGPGFTNVKEKMIPFVHMFEDYDILIINFRGHGLKKKFSFNLLYHYFGVDSSQIKLGESEEHDVFASIDYLRNTKNYKNIIGLGICFGAFVFAKTQGIAQKQGIKGFDKLILDGCWTSLNEFAQKIRNDPYIIINPQLGGATQEVKWIFSKDLFANSIIGAIESLLDIKFNNVDIRDYLKEIKDTPILFFYSKNDLTINRTEFQDLWNSTATNNKIGFITSNPHVLNHLKIKEIYKLTCELFIENEDINNVVYLLDDPEKLMQELLKKFQYKIKNKQVIPMKPNKILANKGSWASISPVMWIGVIYALLYTGYKSGYLHSESAIKFGKLYGIYKFLEFAWRPAIRLLSKI